MDAQHMTMVPIDDESMRFLLGLSNEPGITIDLVDKREPETMEDVKREVDKVLGSSVINRLAGNPSLRDESEDEGVFADDLVFKPLQPPLCEVGPEDAISFLEAINGRLRHEFSLDDYLPFPDEVIFHNPATIVYWDDGEKTVLKCHGDDAFDERMGLMVSAVKKVSAKLKVDDHEELLKTLSKLTSEEMHVVSDALTVVASVVDAMENPEE